MNNDYMYLLYVSQNIDSFYSNYSPHWNIIFVNRELHFVLAIGCIHLWVYPMKLEI